MKLLTWLFGPPPTDHQLKVQARVVAYLKTYGGIDARTAQSLGTTAAHRLFNRLRKKGYLYPANDTRLHLAAECKRAGTLPVASVDGQNVIKRKRGM